MALSLRFYREQMSHLFENTLIEGSHLEPFLKGISPRQLGFFGDIENNDDSIFVEQLVTFIEKNWKIGEQMDDFLHNDQIELFLMRLR